MSGCNACRPTQLRNFALTFLNEKGVQLHVLRSMVNFALSCSAAWPLANGGGVLYPPIMAAHYYTVTWDQLHRDAKALAWRLLGLGPWTGIVAITRGGLIPAAIIARELECRLIECVSVMTYDGETRGEPVISKYPEAAGDGTGWLIIDDLVDSGTTAKLVRKLLPHAHLATIYAKPAGKPVVDTFITEVSQDTWILFPWDSEPQFVAPLARKT